MTTNDDNLGKINNEIINDNKISLIKKNKLTKFYIIKNENLFCIINTIQDIKKYLNNIKNRNLKNILLNQILTNEYTYNFIENFEYESILQLDNRKQKLRLDYEKIQQKIKDLEYGKSQEHYVLPILNNYFKNDLIVMCKYEYSTYDFMGLKSEYLYELKSNNDKFIDYPNAILGIEKLKKGLKQIFLFQFKTETNENELYFFIKPNDFEVKYKKRQIYLKMRDKYNWIFDIPRTELIKINKNETYELPIINENTNTFLDLLMLDKINALHL